LHHQPTPANTIPIAEGFDRDEFLAGRDFTPDDPIKRASRQEVLDALRRHSRDVNVVGREAFFPGGLDALGNPALEFLHGLAANAKLDEMKRHILEVGDQRWLLKGSII
jgi:hypothetical protein